VRESILLQAMCSENLVSYPANRFFSSSIVWPIPTPGFAHFRGLIFCADRRLHDWKIRAISGTVVCVVCALANGIAGLGSIQCWKTSMQVKRSRYSAVRGIVTT
jgi:hypothetical protein